MDKKIPLYKRGNFYVALLMFLFSGAVLWQIFNTTIAESTLLPKMIFGISLVCAIVTLISAIREKKNIVTVGKFKITTKELIVFVLLFVSYYLISILGFYTALFILILGVSRVLWNFSSPKSIIGMLVYSILLIAFIFVLFHYGFHMVMPKGLLI